MSKSKHSFDQICLAHERSQTAVVVELCRKHLRKFPKHVPALLYYAMVQIDLGNFPIAEKSIHRAIKYASPKHLAVAYAQMGHLFKAQGNFKEASVWYRKASKHKPDNAGYHIYLGVNAASHGLHGRAVNHYRRALKCTEGCLDEAYFNLGGFFLGKRNYSEAIRCYEEALKIDPKYGLAKRRLDDAKLALLIANQQ